MNIQDLEYTTEIGRFGTCILCDEDIEGGQIRARVEDQGELGWAHASCAEHADQQVLDDEMLTVEMLGASSGLQSGV